MAVETLGDGLKSSGRVWGPPWPELATRRERQPMADRSASLIRHRFTLPMSGAGERTTRPPHERGGRGAEPVVCIGPGPVYSFVLGTPATKAPGRISSIGSGP